MSNKILVRKNGFFLGVCGGISELLGMPVALVRVLFFISLFPLFGASILFYIFAGIAFPNEALLKLGDRPKFLGVCNALAPKINIHESWFRFAFLMVSLFMGFLPFFIYFGVYIYLLVIDAKPEKPSGGMRDVN